MGGAHQVDSCFNPFQKMSLKIEIQNIVANKYEQCQVLIWPKDASYQANCSSHQLHPTIQFALTSTKQTQANLMHNRYILRIGHICCFNLALAKKIDNK